MYSILAIGFATIITVIAAMVFGPVSYIVTLPFAFFAGMWGGHQDIIRKRR